MKFLRDDRGQDIVEYALLTGIVTVAFIALMPSIQTKIANAFSSWGTSANTLWVPGEPGAGGS